MSGITIRLSWLLCLAWPLLLQAAPDAVTPDGGRYYGPLQGGKLHGAGRIEWDSGASYEGGFAHGVLDGLGVLRTGAGDVYEGGFRDGMMTGQGTMRFRNGDVYTGTFARNRLHGHGRLVTRNGDIFEGDFKDDAFEGRGVHTTADSEYRGEFVAWRYSGQGELRHKDGRVYRGDFADGEYHGKGRFEKDGGAVYEGEFVDGEFRGEGVYTHPSGMRHEGRFANWRPEGPGRFTGQDGDVYEGQFVNGMLEGEGRHLGKDGSVYEGTFKAWRYHGQGRLRSSNGDVYVGGFERGDFDGQGTLAFASARPDGRTALSGQWRYGTLEPTRQERQARLSALERALYLQHSLLDRALASVQPSDPARISMYFLGVAGDGTQEVFRREVEYVRDQFAQKYGTSGRAVTLINSRSTLGQAPMATPISVREALMGIASRMDKEKDILFLFLSSHGSREHDFSLDQSDLNLGDLNAAELGAILAETGIRWKVVVVSACYSGGFIDPIKDDHSLIITASRADRRSFGCDDESEFTYFGEAFFKEALPRNSSFQAAFRDAEAVVNAREQSDLDGREAPADHFSQPQMHTAEPIELHLQQWRSGIGARASN